MVAKITQGLNVYLPDQGYHIPKADIHLESHPPIIQTMGGSGNVIVYEWTIELHLPDRQIREILIDN